VKFLIVVFISCLILTGSAAFGQAKVGTTGSWFLTFSPSVRANGMGEAGVALVDDYSIFFNPGSIGLLHNKERIRFSITPGSSYFDFNPDLKMRYWFISYNVIRGSQLNGGPLNITIAAYRKTFSGSYSQKYYDYPDPYIMEPIDIDVQTQSLSIGISLRRRLQIGIGMGVKWYSEKWAYDNEIESKSHGYDFGALMRYPFEGSLSNNGSSDGMIWAIIPSMGLSFNNIRKGTDWPELRRWGWTVDIGLIKQTPNYPLKLISLMPAYEIETTITGSSPRYSKIKLGIEIAALEALSARYGNTRMYGHSQKNTWGLSLNSRGIARLLSGVYFSQNDQSKEALSKFLLERLQIEFSFARVNINDNGINYYGISVSL